MYSYYLYCVIFRIASYPGFLCSRTDFEWVPTPRKDQKQKTQEKNIPQPRPNPTTSKVAVEKSKEVPRPKPKTEVNVRSQMLFPLNVFSFWSREIVL